MPPTLMAWRKRTVWGLGLVGLTLAGCVNLAGQRPVLAPAPTLGPPTTVASSSGSSPRAAGADPAGQALVSRSGQETGHESPYCPAARGGPEGERSVARCSAAVPADQAPPAARQSSTGGSSLTLDDL